jgi:hypothetical protein
MIKQDEVFVQIPEKTAAEKTAADKAIVKPASAK